MTQRTPDKFTRADLIEEAGNVYFARGENYFEIGNVHSVRERDGIIRATVAGSQSYKTAISVTEDGLIGKCSCPLGQNGEFCKHLVATGLAYIESRKTSGKKTKKAKPITPKDVESYLAEQDTPELVRIIMKQADIDDDFYAMLKMRVAAENAGSNTSEIRKVLRAAMTIRGFVSWRDTDNYMRSIDRVLDQIRTLLTPKQAAQVIELAEYGMDLWEENIGLIDDSNGCMGMLRDGLHELHLEACSIAKPESLALAERLAHRSIESEWDMFYDAYETYGKIFGDPGRSRYREIFETEWNALPPLKAGDEDQQRYGRNSKLEHTMLSFAEVDKDLNLAIRVLSRELSSSYNYLRIAEFCRKFRKRKLALEWAEKGLAAFPNDRNSRLRSFLAEEYLHAKRPDDAMAMIWGNFEPSPSLESYKDLATYARKLKCWDQWREKALTHIRADIDKGKAEFEHEHGADKSQKHQRFPYWQPQPPDHTLLVCIFLWEKCEEDAWNEAKKGGCDNYRWLDLAKLREKKHPEDAIEIYRRQVVPIIERTNNNSYHEAVEFLKKIHTLMNDLGEGEEFQTWLSDLKREYKRKRNFIKYVEQSRKLKN